MIRTLRRRHLIIIVLLCLILPALFVAGLLSRRPIQVMPEIPDKLIAPGGSTSEP